MAQTLSVCERQGLPPAAHKAPWEVRVVGKLVSFSIPFPSPLGRNEPQSAQLGGLAGPTTLGMSWSYGETVEQGGLCLEILYELIGLIQPRFKA